MVRREDEELREQLRAVLKRLQLQGRRQRSLNVTVAGAKSFLGGLVKKHKAVTFQQQASTDLNTGTWLEIMLSCFRAPGNDGPFLYKPLHVRTHSVAGLATAETHQGENQVLLVSADRRWEGGLWCR